MRRTACLALFLTTALALGACDDDTPPVADTGPGIDVLVADAATDLTAEAGQDAATDGPVADQTTGEGGASDAAADAAAVKSAWIKITAGTFTMGSPTTEPCRDTGDETEHSVTLSTDFEISNLEVTQAEFQALMSYNPSSNTACGTDCPVENLDWHQAAAYCNALSTKASLATCYTCTGSGASVSCALDTAYSTGGKDLYDCPGYRLPSEAEWEFAYRAGTKTSLYNGALPAASCSSSDALANDIGWYSKNSGGKTQPVGQKTPNAWKLYDMAGNAQEWVHDGYQKDLGSAAATDPVVAPGGTQGVIRGGSFAHGAADLRGAHRKPQTLANKGTSLGLRCVRSL